jgi:uncharacterized protein YggE
MRKICILVLIATISFVNVSLAQTKKNLPTISTLTTKGTAILSVPADQVQLNLGVTSVNSEAKEALKQNSAVMQKIIAALLKIGLRKGDYQTSSININPNYSARTNSFGSNKIEGYTATSTLDLKTSKLDLTGQIIQEATSEGANQINSITFGLNDVRSNRNLVIQKATANATEDAKMLAIAAGVILKRIVSIEVDDAYGSTVSHTPRLDYMALTEKAGAFPPVEAGDTSVRATVNVTYEVENAG